MKKYLISLLIRDMQMYMTLIYFFLIYHEQNSQTWTTSTQQGCGDTGSPTGGL